MQHDMKEEPRSEEHGDDAMFRVKESQIKLDLESDCSEEQLKQEPADREETGARLEDLFSIYEGHQVKEEVVIGPEVLQHPVPDNIKAVLESLQCQKCNLSGNPLPCTNCKPKNITNAQVSLTLATIISFHRSIT